MDTLPIILIAALIGVVVLFLLFVSQRPQEQSRKDAWAHVASLIGGTTRRGGLTGSYKGRAVDVLLQNHGHETELYFYHLIMKVRIQGFDWAISFGETSFLNPTKDWQIKCDDEALRRRLTEAGAFELVKGEAGKPDVRYRVDKGTLEYRLYVGESTYVPAPEEFERQLNLLARLADLNEELNFW